MSDNSAIEWTDATWNPLLGCTKVSPGCDGCYAIVNARIREKNPNPKIATAYAGLVERTDTGQLDWTGQVNLVPDRLDQPLRWKRPRRIFVNSQSDLFHDQVPDEFIARVFAVMALASQHSFQLLTKRHGRMRSLLNRDGFYAAVLSAAGQMDAGAVTSGGEASLPWPLPNLWLGVSVEEQRWADVRIPALLGTPAAVRWLSCEPLLGPVDLSEYLPGPEPTHGYYVAPRPAVSWVVVGGESGRGARPMQRGWARSLRDQCRSAGTAFHFKQWGEHAPRCTLALCGTPCSCDGVNASHPIEMRRVGKKAAGRQLDGRTWDEFPPAQALAAVGEA